MAIAHAVNKTDVTNLAGKYLTFRLEDEHYGLEILRVREIIGLMDITEVPRTPSHIRGVINLRGKIIPVIDLRTKFNMPAVEHTDQTCIIVIDAVFGDTTTLMGILVDAVSEVLDIAAEHIEPPPTLGEGIEAEFVRGLTKSDSKVTILIDVQRVLGSHDITGVLETISNPGNAEAEPSQ